MSATKLLGNVFSYFFSNILLICGKNNTLNKVAITFDDGPDQQHTDHILNVLAKLNVKATFFITGENAKKYPNLVKNIYNAGHQIGNHGFLHIDAKKTDADKYLADVMEAQKQIEEILGRRIKRIFRPPYGSITISSFIKLVRKGFQIIMWSYDSDDSYILDHSKLLAHLKNSIPKPGSILLFHEDYGHTVKILQEILSSYKERGYRMCTIDELQK